LHALRSLSLPDALPIFTPQAAAREDRDLDLRGILPVALIRAEQPSQLAAGQAQQACDGDIREEGSARGADIRVGAQQGMLCAHEDRKSTRLNSSHVTIT